MSALRRPCPACAFWALSAPATQVELSLTDARSIGVTAPIRESGDIAGSGACKLVGPKGEVELTEGVIAAKRHIHMTTADAAAMGLRDKDVVSVSVPSANGRALTFGDVVVRVSDKLCAGHAHRHRRVQRRPRGPRHYGRDCQVRNEQPDPAGSFLRRIRLFIRFVKDGAGAAPTNHT